MIGAAIRSILVNNATVAALTTKIFPNTIPQGTTWPAMYYQLIGSRATNTKDQDAGLDFLVVRFTIYSPSYSNVSQIAAAVRGALSYYPRGVVSGVYIQRITFDSGMEDYEQEAKLHKRIIDFEILTKP